MMKMVIFSMIFVAFGMVPSFSQAACGNQIDKKKVIFMIDALGDLPALEAAEAGGCDRGEFVVSIPPREVIEYTYKYLKAPQMDLQKNLAAADEVLKKNEHELEICDPAICSKERRGDLQLLVKEAKNKYKKLRADYAEIEPKFLKEYKEKFIIDPLDARLKILFELGEMKKKDQVITAVILSGYGGGDDLHGILTSKMYYKSRIRRSELREAFRENPITAYDVPILIFSNDEPLTDFENVEWKRIFPKLKFWAMVDENPASVKDVLIKPMSIDGFTSPKKGALVQSDLGVCDKFLDQMVHGVERNYFNFFYGKHLGPKDSPHPVMRRHYSFFKDSRNCMSVTYPQIAVEQSGFMVYIENVKKNFAKVFEKEIAESERVIASLSEDAWGVKLSSSVRAIKEEYTTLKSGKIAAATRDQIIHNLALMALAKDPEIKRVKGLIQKYLFEMSPKCMNLDEWHEFSPGHSPRGLCKP